VLLKRAIVLGLTVALVAAGAAAAYGPKLTNEAVYQDSTWSIVAYDPSTGEIGVIVQTCRPAVGNRCPWVETGVGAVSTQASTNPLLATRVLGLLAKGSTAQQALDVAIAEDTGAQSRQVIVVDHRGNVAAWTGTGPSDYKGHILRENFAVAGNILVGPEVLTATADAFELATGPLAYRLLAAMQAGQAQGGDSRGKMSIGLKVARPGWVPFVDLRADHNTADPFAEMYRLLNIGYATSGGLGWANPYRAPQLGYRPLAISDLGVDVSHIQVMLRDLGYYKGAITGTFDGLTNSAVRALQRSAGLKLDGIVHGDTLNHLVASWLRIWPTHP
jgi:uncharacterized Ntn-hydrolase superfamily protein